MVRILLLCVIIADLTLHAESSVHTSTLTQQAESITEALIELTSTSRGDGLSAIINSKLYGNISRELRRDINKLQEQRAGLKALQKKSDRTVGYRDYQYDIGKGLFYWWQFYRKPRYVIPLGAYEGKAGRIFVKVFESNPSEDSGRGTGPYSALVVFEFRSDNGVLKLTDIDVTGISDGPWELSVHEKTKSLIQSIKELRAELEGIANPR